MAISNKKYEVSDPAFYGQLISDQNKHIKKRPYDSNEWVESGRLHEARIDMTNYFARKKFGIRHFLLIYALFLLLPIIVVSHFISKLTPFSLQHIVVISIVIILLIISLQYVWSLRYPPSGKRYFKKAISLNPGCGEAYMYLGLIALRRYQKRKGCELLEQAIGLNVNSKKIERELKTIYEKEFMAFFNKKSEKEIRLEALVDSQMKQIKEFRSKVYSLEGLTESLGNRATQAKWEVTHKTKLLTREMKERIEVIQKDYEKQIEDMKRAEDLEEEKKELAERDFLRLTTEVMEAKVELEGRSLEKASKDVEDIMGSHLWDALLPQTRTYLSTAEHIFKVLIEEREKPDYSLVGMELCKALETEINRTLVTPFLQYLNGNEKDFLNVNRVGESKGKPFYFTYLAKMVDRDNFPGMKSLTLGQYHFLLERTLKGEYALSEYSDFLNQVCPTPETGIDKGFLKRLEKVTKKYRNTIAHESAMNRSQCDRLRNLIFAGESALLKTCCRIET